MNSDPADVAALAVGEVEAAEAQPVLRRVQLGDLLAVLQAENLAFGPCLVRAALLAEHPGEPAGGSLAELVQPAIKHRDISLLGGDVLV